MNPDFFFRLDDLILPFPICRNTSCCWFLSLQFFLLWISSSMEWMTTFFSFGIILLMIIIFGRRLFSCWWSDVWIFGQSAFGKCTKQFSCILKSCWGTSFNFSSRCRWNCWFFIVIPRKEAKNGIVNFGSVKKTGFSGRLPSKIQREISGPICFLANDLLVVIGYLLSNYLDQFIGEKRKYVA